jgi:FkbM family methyltransferase
MLFTPRSGQCVLDIGANDGTYAEGYANAVGPEGRVYAIEPHRTAYEKAVTRLKPYPWVHVLHGAAWSSLQELTFWSDDSDTRRSSVWPDNRIDGGESQTVDAAPIDDLLGLMPYPDWIKVDAQGAEVHILLGAQRTLDDRKARWCVELWPWGLQQAGASVDSVLHEFQRRGYTAIVHGTAHTYDAVRASAAQKKKHGSIDVVFVPPQSSER